MGDWSKPALTDSYANFRQYLDDRLNDLVKGNDPAAVTLTNYPTLSIRYSTSNARWQQYNGSSWVDLSSNTHQINITGNAGSATTAGAAPWSGITSKPTTVSGYGITDAITTAGGQTINGNLSLNSGDFYCYRSGGTTGVVFLNNSASRYLYWDGTNYNLPGGEVLANGFQLARLSSPTFTGTPAAPTASVGANSTQLATTAFVRDAYIGSPSQSWQDVTASRAISTNYTNSTGRPIMVAVYASLQGYTSANGYVNGVQVVAFSTGAYNFASTLVFIVPPGATYSAYVGTNYGGTTWMELR